MSILSNFNTLGQIYQFYDAVANAFIRFSAFSFTNDLLLNCQSSLWWSMPTFFSFPCFTANGEFSFENSKSNNLTAAVFFHDFVFVMKECTLRA